MQHSMTTGGGPDSSPGRPDAADSAAKRIVVRHSLITRLTHWTNVIAMTVLLMSGLQIFNAHPALYWSDAGFDYTSAVFAIDGSNDEDKPAGWLRIGRHQFVTTGFLGVSNLSESADFQAFPGWATLPTWRDLATGRRWHFFFAWVLVVNGLLYMCAGIFSGHFRRDLWPRLSELSLRHLVTSLWDHARLRWPKGEAALSYNVLQKLAYLFLIGLLVPLIVLTGWSMSPGLNAAAPWLPALFGGRQAARLLHFVAANLLVLFVLVHLLALLAVGVWNELRSMITGRYVVPRER